MTVSILWCGGEDVDFQNQFASGINVNTGSQYRSGYAREALQTISGVSTATVRGAAFPGGAITSCWFHFIAYNGFTWNGNNLVAGLALSSSLNGSGLYVGCSSTNKLGLFKWDGSTLTQLATGASVLSVNTPLQVDMQLTSYGSSATVNIYLSGSSSAELTYSGSTTVSGVSNLDCVALASRNTNIVCSEFIVSDSDTRAMSLVTLSPSAAGDTTGTWTGTYANINPTAANDASVIYNNATGSDLNVNVNDMPSGTFAVLAVKVTARAQLTSGATPTGFKLGVKSSSTVNVDAGHTPGASWQIFERFMATNPVTSAAWTTSDINALQLDVQSM